MHPYEGSPFQALLWSAWKPLPYNSQAHVCVNCGRDTPSVARRITSARGLCNNCYARWNKYRKDLRKVHLAEAMTTTPVRYSGIKRYEDSALAARIGVNLTTLHQWRSGRTAPRLSETLVTSLEIEFNIPATAWEQAIGASHLFRDIGRSHKKREERINASIGNQYGYWLVIAGLPDIHDQRANGASAGIAYVTARCLLCRAEEAQGLSRLERRTTTSCRDCSSRRQGNKKKSISGYKGVHHRDNMGERQWEVKFKTTGSPTRYFSNAVDAARHYDRCIYEKYGHTVFLNFPEEYDQSGDPKFAYTA